MSALIVPRSTSFCEPEGDGERGWTIFFSPNITLIPAVVPSFDTLSFCRRHQENGNDLNMLNRSYHVIKMLRSQFFFLILA